MRRLFRCKIVVRGYFRGMKTITLVSLPVLLGLASCSGGMSSGPLTAAQAKADNATFLSGLSPAARQTAMFCQVQMQNKLGGTVYLVAAPSLQASDITANASTNAIAQGLTVVYDRIDNGAVTSAARKCKLSSENLVVRPSHAE
ncbi:hypothetical protein SAMN05421828_102230 [Acidiphilium rubrum]|uniref:Lipoprotein n=2 Tax=Acidocellaceae TaxID=3385905 RepID=A0A8G2CIA5_ACIRU|nr:hypothetical protein SAMN05421828_102230 [Acidiphilium rubrum]